MDKEIVEEDWAFTPSAMSDYIKEHFTVEDIDIIDRLQHNDTFVFDMFKHNVYLDWFIDDSIKFQNALKRAIYETYNIRYIDRPLYGLKIEFKEKEITEVHDINPTMEGSPITINARIIAIDERRTFTEWAFFRCPTCGNEEKIDCDEYRKLRTPKCINKDCRKETMYIQNSKKKTEYIQVLRVQEFLENSRHNSPVEFDAYIIGKDVGDAYVSHRKKMTVVFRSIPNNKTGFNDILLEIVSMSDIDVTEVPLPSDEELIKWKKEVNILDVLSSSFAPELYMNKNIKLSVLMYMVGGIGVNGKRDIINILIMGDPSVGKSELQRHVTKIMPNSACVIANGSSKAGLTIGIVKLSNGRMVALAGTIPSYNNGLVCIDEFDKMNKDEGNGLLECMEQGTVTIDKAGIRQSLPAKTGIFGAGNPVNGKYDDELGLLENFRIYPALLSRFDIVWLMLDEIDEDDAFMEHVETFKEGECMMDHDELQRYIHYAKSLDVTIPDDSKLVLKELYKKLRKLYNTGSITIDKRKYYGFIRLLTAYARLKLHSTATREDAIEVKKIILDYFKSIKINVEEGKNDLTMFVSMNKEQTAIHVFKVLQSKNTDGVTYMQYMDELKQQDGFKEMDAEKQWEKLYNGGRFLKNKNGKWTWVD